MPFCKIGIGMFFAKLRLRHYWGIAFESSSLSTCSAASTKSLSRLRSWFHCQRGSSKSSGSPSNKIEFSLSLSLSKEENKIFGFQSHNGSQKWKLHRPNFFLSLQRLTFPFMFLKWKSVHITASLNAKVRHGESILAPYILQPWVRIPYSLFHNLIDLFVWLRQILKCLNGKKTLNA